MLMMVRVSQSKDERANHASRRLILSATLEKMLKSTVMLSAAPEKMLGSIGNRFPGAKSKHGVCVDRFKFNVTLELNRQPQADGYTTQSDDIL
jgi:hypothetical protein